MIQSDSVNETDEWCPVEDKPAGFRTESEMSVSSVCGCKRPSAMYVLKP